MSDGPARRAAAGNLIALGVHNANLTDALWSVLVIGRGMEITNFADRTQFQGLGLSQPHTVRWCRPICAPINGLGKPAAANLAISSFSRSDNRSTTTPPNRSSSIEGADALTP
jgi:hypothetical protein